MYQERNIHPHITYPFEIGIFLQVVSVNIIMIPKKPQ
jgi:hypothetical protein